jgi:lipopolysaccharide transport system permease protein
MKSARSLFVNPHASSSLSPLSLAKTIFFNRQLIIQLVRRDVLGRYRGSMLGILWSFFSPILMLVIYTFVFAVVFKARWGGSTSDSKAEFALILFAGMNVFAIFADSINQAPSLIINNSNYVKKVVFPLELLPIINIGTSLFHVFIGFMVLIFGLIIINGYINWTIIYLPLILLPLIILTIGLSWFLASFGVFLPDIRQAIGIFTTVLMFLSPVFYPVSALPVRFQNMVFLNPLTFIIEQTRGVVIFGAPPDWRGLLIYGLIASAIAWLGFAWFQKTRKGFADVL